MSRTEGCSYTQARQRKMKGEEVNMLGAFVFHELVLVLSISPISVEHPVCSPRRGRLCSSQGSSSPALLPAAPVAASQGLCCFLGALRAIPGMEYLGWGPNPAGVSVPPQPPPSPALAPADAELSCLLCWEGS